MDEPNPAKRGDEGPTTVRLAPGVFVRADALRWSFSRSGGPGGQHTNKVATAAELRVSVSELPIPAPALARLRRAAGSKLTKLDELVITSESERSQRRNREDCLTKLREMVARALVAPKPRRPTKPTRGSVERRLDAKKQRGETKKRRAWKRDAGE